MLKACYSPRYFAQTHTNSMEKLTAVADVLAAQHIEPYRVCRRLNILRDYSDEKTKLYPRN